MSQERRPPYENVQSGEFAGDGLDLAQVWLASYLQYYDQEAVNAKTRNSIPRQAMSWLSQHPDQMIDVARVANDFRILTETTAAIDFKGDVVRNNLIRWLNLPRDIYESCAVGANPTTKQIIRLIDRAEINDPIVRVVIGGVFDRPVKRLTDTNRGNSELISKRLTEAVEVGKAFYRALVDYGGNPEQISKILKIWDDEIVIQDEKQRTLFDLIHIAAISSGDKILAAEASAVLRGIGILEADTLPPEEQDINKIYRWQEAVSRFAAHYGIKFDLNHLPDIDRKCMVIWDTAMEVLDDNQLQTVWLEPELTDLGMEVLERQLGRATGLLDQQGLTVVGHYFPGGRMLIVMGEPDLINTLSSEFTDSALLESLIKPEGFTESGKLVMTLDELDTVVQISRHHIDWDPAAHKEALYQVKLGLHELRRRGNEVKFTKKSARELWDLGMRGIRFLPADQGTLVEVLFENFVFPFYLNRLNEPMGWDSEQLSDENQRWLTTLTLACLAHFKNPGLVNVRGGLVTHESTSERGSIGGPAHLRVLYLGNHPRYSKQVNADFAETHDGVDLDTLNRYWLEAQQDWEGAFIIAPPVVQGLLLTMRARVERREEQPEWKGDGDRWSMALPPIPGYEEKNYRVTWVKEPDNLPPQEVEFPGLIEELQGAGN